MDKSYPALDEEPFAEDLPQNFGYFDENLSPFYFTNHFTSPSIWRD
jgi:hypothetical protein